MRVRLALMVVLTFPFLGLAQSEVRPPCQWTAGMYWQWESVSNQTASTDTITVYLLVSERWGDYEVDFLALIWPYGGTHTVQLGAAVRQPCGPMRGFGLWAANAHRWWHYPPGTVVEERWAGEGIEEGTLVISVLADDVTVEVPAGTFAGCVHLTYAGELTEGDGQVVQEELWFSPELGWPVRGAFRYRGGPEMRYRLLALGKVKVEEAVDRVLAVVDEMATMSPTLAAQAESVREQLRFLGLLNEK